MTIEEIKKYVNLQYTLLLLIQKLVEVLNRLEEIYNTLCYY